MTNPIIRIHDLETNQVIDREMNAEELAAWEANQIAEEERKAAYAEKAANRAALLVKLGITEDEAKLLLS